MSDIEYLKKHCGTWLTQQFFMTSLMNQPNVIEVMMPNFNIRKFIVYKSSLFDYRELLGVLSFFGRYSWNSFPKYYGDGIVDQKLCDFLIENDILSLSEIKHSIYKNVAPEHRILIGQGFESFIAALHCDSNNFTYDIFDILDKPNE